MTCCQACHDISSLPPDSDAQQSAAPGDTCKFASSAKHDAALCICKLCGAALYVLCGSEVCLEIQMFNTPVQTKNARERLAATFVEGQAMPEGFGGEATMQDLLRLVLCAHIACDRDVKRSSNIVSEEDAQVGLCFWQCSDVGVIDTMRFISKST